MGFRRSHSHKAGKAPHSPLHLHYSTETAQDHQETLKGIHKPKPKIRETNKHKVIPAAHELFQKGPAHMASCNIFLSPHEFSVRQPTSISSSLAPCRKSLQVWSSNFKHKFPACKQNSLMLTTKSTCVVHHHAYMPIKFLRSQHIIH